MLLCPFLIPITRTTKPFFKMNISLHPTREGKHAVILHFSAAVMALLIFAVGHLHPGFAALIGMWLSLPIAGAVLLGAVLSLITAVRQWRNHNRLALPHLLLAALVFIFVGYLLFEETAPAFLKFAFPLYLIFSILFFAQWLLQKNQ